MDSANNDKRNLLRIYRDKIYIMILICSQSSGYYGKINNNITAILILISTILSILNGILNMGSLELKYINIIFNAFTAIIIGFNRAFRFSERSSDFHKYCLNFTKLEHRIENEYNIKNTISDEFLEKTIETYGAYLDSLQYSIPDHVIKNVKNKVGDKYTLPLSLGGNPVELKQIDIQNPVSLSNNTLIKDNVLE